MFVETTAANQQIFPARLSKKLEARIEVVGMTNLMREVEFSTDSRSFRN